MPGPGKGLSPPVIIDGWKHPQLLTAVSTTASASKAASAYSGTDLIPGAELTGKTARTGTNGFVPGKTMEVKLW